MYLFSYISHITLTIKTMASLKNYILILFLFQFTLYAQVAATINQLKIDNTPITTNTITFNNNPTINISLNVHLETSNGSIDNTFGNLNIYYKKNESDIPMQLGFYSVTFYLKTYYINDTPFNTITLNKNEFFNTGGILYAEYKNNKKETYQSAKIAIIGGSLTSIPANPTPTNQKIISQNLKYSDNFPITNAKILVAADTPTSFDVDIYHVQGQGQFSTVNICAYEEYGTKVIYLKSLDIGDQSFNSYFSIKNIKINYDALDFTKYTCKLKIEVRNYSKDLSSFKSNIDILSQNNQDVTINIVKPILDNTISDNQTIKYGQTAKPFTLSSSPYVDYSIRCERNVRACTTIYDYRYITSFKWQTTTQNSNWSDIEGETLQEYSPNKAFTENTYYRRLAFVNNHQYKISNIASIIIEDTNITNNICCDQPLPLSDSQPQEIIGNNIISNNYRYQWQSSKNSRGDDFLPWQDIIGATNQNYKHIFTENAATNNEKTKFRRIIKLNSLPINISNAITISRYSTLDFTPPSRRGTLQSQSFINLNTNEPIENNETNLSIYPNPLTNSLSIEGLVNINLINLYDSFGQKINIDKHQKSDNLIEVNTSKLQSGIYILKIDNTTFSKTLIKN